VTSSLAKATSSSPNIPAPQISQHKFRDTHFNLVYLHISQIQPDHTISSLSNQKAYRMLPTKMYFEGHIRDGVVVVVVVVVVAIIKMQQMLGNHQASFPSSRRSLSQILPSAYLRVFQIRPLLKLFRDPTLWQPHQQTWKLQLQLSKCFKMSQLMFDLQQPRRPNDQSFK
jgi:hypothetical protein